MSAKKITTIGELTFHQKKRIIFCRMRYNDPVERVAYNMGISEKIISEYISFVMSNLEEANKMLPSDLHDKQKIKYRMFEPVTYYSHLQGWDQELMATLSYKPTYDDKNIDNERPYPVLGQESFSEIIGRDIYKVGRELNQRKERTLPEPDTHFERLINKYHEQRKTI